MNIKSFKNLIFLFSVLPDIFFSILFSVSSAHAFFERKLSIAAGINPAGANLSAALAYNYKFWDKSENNFWNYGYIRPKITYESSIFINTLSAELQFYPISIFGVSIGSKYAYRSVKSLNEFDCDKVNCKGELGRNYYRLNLNLGYSNLTTAIVYQKDFLYSGKHDTNLVEYSSMLLLPEDTGYLEHKIGYFGYKISDGIDVGFFEDLSNLSNQKAEGQFFVTSLKQESLKWIFGVGTFGTDYNEKRFSAFVKVSWLLDPTLSLND